MNFRSYLQQFRQSFKHGGKARPGTKRPMRLLVEALEDRTLPVARLTLSGVQTLVPNANLNFSNDAAASQSEMVVDINPTNPLNVAGFVHQMVPVLNMGVVTVFDLNQIDVFVSTDGGATWLLTAITDVGNDGMVGTNDDDGLGWGARFDPAIRFD